MHLYPKRFLRYFCPGPGRALPFLLPTTREAELLLLWALPSFGFFSCLLFVEGVGIYVKEKSPEFKTWSIYRGKVSCLCLQINNLFLCFLRFFWCGPFLTSLYWFCYNTASISMLWIFGCKACGSSVPRPGIKPTSPALEGEVLTSAREVPNALWLRYIAVCDGCVFLTHWVTSLGNLGPDIGAEDAAQEGDSCRVLTTDATLAAWIL